LEKFDTARYYACQKGFVKIFRLLMQLPDTYFSNPLLPLRDAIQQGRTEIVRMILDLPPERRGGFTGEDLCTTTNPEIVRMAIDSITDPFQRSRVCATAGMGGRTDIIRMLIDNARKHGDLNMDDGGALEQAAIAGHMDIIRMFLGQRIRYTVIEAASRAGRIGILRLLIDNQMTKFGETNIGRSLEQVAGGEDEHVEVVRLILSYPRYRGVHPKAIQNAVSYGHMKILRLLLDSIPAGTELGSSLDDAIDSAARIIRYKEDRSEMFSLLLNYYDPKNPVPLRAAADCGNVEMVRYILMKCGSGDDVVALRMAQKKGFKDIIELLSAKKEGKQTAKQAKQKKHKR
jgi:ankyrin repeat protein